MSSKTGRKPTGRKPETVRRQSAKSDGAFGKEQKEQLNTTDSSRNVDKSVKQRTAGG